MSRNLTWTEADRRRGTLLIGVLACLTLCTLLLTFWIRLIGLERRQVRNHQAAMQAEIFADAAIVRGQRRAQADASYAGETWKPAGGAIPSAEAKISVTPAAEDSTDRRLEVTAEIGGGSKLSVRRSRTQPIPKIAEEPAP